MNPINKARLIAMAREDIAKYLVAVQDKALAQMPAGSRRWEDIKPGSLANARNEYDAGFIDFVQQRVGDREYLQYAIPRKNRAKIDAHMTFAVALRGAAEIAQ